MSEIVYRAEKLNLGYKISSKENKLVLEGVNFEFKRGELISLLGPNGVGKSTLIKTLCGFLKPLAGILTFENEKIDSFSKREISKKIGVVLTERNSEGGFTVTELVSLGRYPYTGFFGSLTEKDNIVVQESIEKIGVTHLKDRYVAELSDGERQKVMIAKTLAQECPVIILDEPTAFLDLKSKVEITSLLRDLARKENKCVIMSTHDLELALQLSDKLCLISKESPCVYGGTEDLVLEGRLNSIFGSDNKHVVFDESTGMFKSVKHNNKKIKVSGDLIPLFWVKNALLRNRYSPCEQDDVECDVEVIVKSSKDITLKVKDKEFNFISVDGLLKGIKQI